MMNQVCVRLRKMSASQRQTHTHIHRAHSHFLSLAAILILMAKPESVTVTPDFQGVGCALGVPASFLSIVAEAHAKSRRKSSLARAEAICKPHAPTHQTKIASQGKVRGSLGNDNISNTDTPRRIAPRLHTRSAKPC